MSFTLVDIILIIIFFGFVFSGFAMGMIRSIGAIAGLAAGTWVAGHYFVAPADWLTPIIGGNGSLAKIISFFVIFLLVDRLTVFIFKIINRGFRLLSILPFLKTLNRLGGVILGAVEGILALGLVIYIIAKFFPAAGLVTDHFDNSQAAHFFVSMAQWLIALLPGAFGNIKSIF
ncbi:MAG: CvpA family protein [Patescibacteria group bacterium]